MLAKAKGPSYIPRDAYLYFPKESDTKNLEGVRFIFDGNTKFSDLEIKMVEQFKIYAQKYNFTFKSIWGESMILRYLQANGFTLDKTLNSVKEHTIWRANKVPIELTDKIIEYLEKGIIYVHGRDCRFRPIIIFNVYMLDIKTCDVELMIDTLTYLLEFVVEEYLLPGQAENWIFILDLKDMGLATIPLNPLKKMLGYLQHNYRGRLYEMHIINTPSTIYVPWQIAKKFVEESTINKIQFHKKQIPESLFTHTNRDQIEAKYGGNAPNLVQYWPPIVPSENYRIPEDDIQLISEDDYIKMFENGVLARYKINTELVSELPSTINIEGDQDQSITNPIYVKNTNRADGRTTSPLEYKTSLNYSLLNQSTRIRFNDGKNHDASTLPEMRDNKSRFSSYDLNKHDNGQSIRVVKNDTEGADFLTLMDEKPKRGTNNRMKEMIEEADEFVDVNAPTPQNDRNAKKATFLSRPGSYQVTDIGYSGTQMDEGQIDEGGVEIPKINYKSMNKN